MYHPLLAWSLSIILSVINNDNLRQWNGKKKTMPKKQNELQPLPPAPLVLLDRDGVINEDVGSPGIISVSQLRLTPNAGRAIGRLKRYGCSVVMVTNQSSVGKGLLNLNELNTIQQRVQELLWEQDEDATFDRIYQCTSDDPNHPRRKPNPGMVQEALQDFGRHIGASSSSSTSTIASCDHRRRTYMVGDTSTDLQAAAASGGVDYRILVSTGYGRTLMTRKGYPLDIQYHHDDPNGRVEYPVMDPVWIHEVVGIFPNIHPSTVPFLYCQNLEQAIEYILEQEKEQTSTRSSAGVVVP